MEFANGLCGKRLIGIGLLHGVIDHYFPPRSSSGNERVEE
jgi:hypothetical protein